MAKDEKTTNITNDEAVETDFEAPKEIHTSKLLYRFGILSAVLFCFSSLLILGCIGFLLFLWYGDDRNNVWYDIMVNDWCLKSIAFTSTAIRWAADIQTGACLSMLAAVALETFAVPHHAAAAVSIMRVNGASILRTLLNFVYPISMAGFRINVVTLVSGALMILLTSTALQFTSTLLLSDVSVQLIPSKSVIHAREFNFGWDYSASPKTNRSYGFGLSRYNASNIWMTSRPNVFPAFAEYHEEHFKHENVSDTGVNLRAFLPLNEVERSSVRSYSGKALLLDSRVTCQRPIIQEAYGWAVDTGGSKRIWGRLNAPVDTPRLNKPDYPIYFDCPFLWKENVYSLCELPNDAIIASRLYRSLVNGSVDSTYRDAPFSGGLLSEFREDATNKSGAAFLIITATQSDFSSEFVEYPFQEQSYASAWSSNRINFASSNQNSSIPPIHLTICFTALDTADRDIQAFSDSNRTEPAITHANGLYNYSMVGKQLNPIAGISIEERGLLNITKLSSWAQPVSKAKYADGPVEMLMDLDEDTAYQASSNLLPWLNGMLHLSGTYHDANFVWPAALEGNCTMMLGSDLNGDRVQGYLLSTWADTCYYESQMWFNDIFLYFLNIDPNGNVAVALQSVLTTFASLAYYAALPDFDKNSTFIKTSWEAHNTPGGELGHRRTSAQVPKGLLSIVGILGTHLVMVLLIFRLFIVHSRHSRLGDPWQAVAHVASSDEGQPFLDSPIRQPRFPGRSSMADSEGVAQCVGLHHSEEGKVTLQKYKPT